jgi:hypothetical protein
VPFPPFRGPGFGGPRRAVFPQTISPSGIPSQEAVALPRVRDVGLLLQAQIVVLGNKTKGSAPLLRTPD